jgi:HAD superfamily phosphoserine phosphatase-like hydrolase
MKHASSPLAFFDLDRTLVAENTGRLWVEHERREGTISSLQAARAMLWLGLYHLSLIDLDRAYSQALAHYRGVADSELRARTEAWFLVQVAHRLQPGARAALDWHRAQGHRCVMLTNSSPYQAAVATRTWGLDGWVSNHFVADGDGLLTGEIERPICYGAGKTTRAERWAKEHGGRASRRAGSTPTPSPTFRCSRWSSVRASCSPTHGFGGRRCSAAGPSSTGGQPMARWRV